MTEILKLPGWCPNDKADILESLAEQVKNRTHHGVIVEIGTYGGRSFFPMVKGSKGHALCIGIDPYNTGDCLEGQMEEKHVAWWGNVDLHQVRLAYERELAKYPHAVHIYRKSQDAVDMFNDRSIDLLHIDGNHSEQVSLQDVKNWEPKIKRDGVIVFDDIDWPSTKRAQDELYRRGWRKVNKHNNWGVYKQ